MTPCQIRPIHTLYVCGYSVFVPPPFRRVCTSSPITTTALVESPLDMSIRSTPATPERAGRSESLDEIGSLFGFALDLGDATWSRLAGSPILRSSSAALIGESSLDSICEDSFMEMSHGPSSSVLVPPPTSTRTLESFVHLEMLPSQDDDTFALASFWRHDDHTSEVAIDRREGNGMRVNLDPVWPQALYFDNIEWVPVSNGGHRFLLQTGDGGTVGYIEAAEHVRGELHRIVVVHGARSLEFLTPAGHARKLRGIVNGSSNDEFYLPIEEVVVGNALRRCPVCVSEGNRAREAFANAERVWMEALDALTEISELALIGIRKHNELELS